MVAVCLFTIRMKKPILYESYEKKDITQVCGGYNANKRREEKVKVNTLISLRNIIINK